MEQNDYRETKLHPNNYQQLPATKQLQTQNNYDETKKNTQNYVQRQGQAKQRQTQRTTAVFVTETKSNNKRSQTDAKRYKETQNDFQSGCLAATSVLCSVTPQCVWQHAVPSLEIHSYTKCYKTFNHVLNSFIYNWRGMQFSFMMFVWHVPFIELNTHYRGLHSGYGVR